MRMPVRNTGISRTYDVRAYDEVRGYEIQAYNVIMEAVNILYIYKRKNI